MTSQHRTLEILLYPIYLPEDLFPFEIKRRVVAEMVLARCSKPTRNQDGDACCICHVAQRGGQLNANKNSQSVAATTRTHARLPIHSHSSFYYISLLHKYPHAATNPTTTPNLLVKTRICTLNSSHNETYASPRMEMETARTLLILGTYRHQNRSATVPFEHP